MQLHQLQRRNKSKSKKRVGRGGVRGKTAGRGHKGQKSRAGHRIRPAIRDVIKKLPKKRGYKFPRFKKKPAPVNLAVIDEAYSNGEHVTPKTLVEKGILERRKDLAPLVKILAQGTLSKKITVSNCLISASAKSMVEKAGGSVEQV